MIVGAPTIFKLATSKLLFCIPIAQNLRMSEEAKARITLINSSSGLVDPLGS